MGFPGGFRGSGVCLDLYPQGIVLRPRFTWLGWCVPRVELEWSDIESVERRWMDVRVVRPDKPGATFRFCGLGAKRAMASLQSYPVRVMAT